jgi:hypothetical protein
VDARRVVARALLLWVLRMVRSGCSWVCGHLIGDFDGGDLGGFFCCAAFGRGPAERTRRGVLGGSGISSSTASESDTFLAAKVSCDILGVIGVSSASERYKLLIAFAAESASFFFARRVAVRWAASIERPLFLGLSVDARRVAAGSFERALRLSSAAVEARRNSVGVGVSEAVR